MIDYDPRSWTSQLFSLRGTVAPRIILRVLLFGAWAAVVVTFHSFVLPVEVPSTVHTLLGIALGLLLVFRTNASYDRFWEGRTIWGSIVNDCRNLARASTAFLGRQSGRLEPLLAWTVAFPYASMHWLRGRTSLGPIEARLPAEAVDAALKAPHVPLAVALRMSTLLDDARRGGELSDYLAATIDNNVRLLVDHIGACERIRNTPLPFAYVAHLRRALILYCVTLPFALVNPYGWLTVLYTVLVAYILCGIDDIGVEIENPFGEDYNDLPLDRICATIEHDVLGSGEPLSGRR
jgi:putative membrane protein